MNLAPYIEYTSLQPDISRATIKAICRRAREFEVSNIVVPPYLVGLARQALEATRIRLGSVVGFPFGHDHCSSKEVSLRTSVRAGACFLNIAINVAAIKSGKWNYVADEVHRLVAMCTLMNVEHKFIFDIGLLQPEEIERLCTIMNREGVDFVQISTTLSASIPEVEQVVAVRRLLNRNVQIKVAMHSLNRIAAIRLIKAGADRVGTAEPEKILRYSHEE